ncbi:MAG: AmmeMemoRadiSam system protein A [Candidatus Latescibacteria bacterium]|nr:AmmeMemoRadiSam system protein A [Candidatus Latescibacterota bacterium]
MANSGDVTGDNDSVVGYISAALTIPGESSKDAVGVDLGLSDYEKKVLKNVVKATLETVVNGGGVPRYNNFAGKLGKKWGAFVTLNKNGQLRGCIGHIIGTQPLITTVAEMTRAAALDDPRFSRVLPDELPDIEYEISVLTPIREIDDIGEIVVGRDGIIITRGMYRGLLLPQVATEYGWDRITFLEQTCRKAGLPKDAWKDDDTKIEIFSAEIIE